MCRCSIRLQALQRRMSISSDGETESRGARWIYVKWGAYCQLYRDIFSVSVLLAGATEEYRTNLYYLMCSRMAKKVNSVLRPGKHLVHYQWKWPLCNEITFLCERSQFPVRSSPVLMICIAGSSVRYGVNRKSRVLRIHWSVQSSVVLTNSQLENQLDRINV